MKECPLLESFLLRPYHLLVNGFSVYQIMADLIVIIHGLFIIFVLSGSILGLFFPRMIWLHIPCVIWGIIMEMSGYICPLTYLENEFREKSGAVPYGGDFIVHYLEPVIYPAGLTRDVQYLFGAVVFVVNAVAYGWIFIHRRRKLKPSL